MLSQFSQPKSPEHLSLRHVVDPSRSALINEAPEDMHLMCHMHGMNRDDSDSHNVLKPRYGRGCAELPVKNYKTGMHWAQQACVLLSECSSELPR